MERALANCHVLVAGALRGIGKAADHAFAGAGCKEHLASWSFPDLEATAEQLREISDRPERVHARDLMQPVDLARFARDCRDVDILVNKVRATPTGSIESVTEAQGRDGFELNVVPTKLLTGAI